jgi:hypothetical protein
VTQATALGAGRHVADRDRKPGGLGEGSQFLLPQPQPVAVGASRVRGDQELRRAGVGRAADAGPPAADGLHSELGGVAIAAHRHPARVGAQVVDAVRYGLALLAGEVVNFGPARVPGRTPGPALAGVLADQFLLLRIDADYRLARGEGSGDPVVDVAELGVAIRVLLALDGLGAGFAGCTPAVRPAAARRCGGRSGAPGVPVPRPGCGSTWWSIATGSSDRPGSPARPARPGHSATPDQYQSAAYVPRRDGAHAPASGPCPLPAPPPRRSPSPATPQLPGPPARPRHNPATWPRPPAADGAAARPDAARSPRTSLPAPAHQSP